MNSFSGFVSTVIVLISVIMDLHLVHRCETKFLDPQSARDLLIFHGVVQPLEFE